jgi:SAM-dependent methyltransferase
MTRRVSRPGVREGYDRWAESYDRSPNPVVALDRRYAFSCLAPRPGERILDAGCGTGANLRALLHAGSRPLGVDFSRGMLRVARRAAPGVPLAQADLERGLPLARRVCDALLCTLVSEHLREPLALFREAVAVLRPGGRFVFSAFHPELAAAGVEANFEQDGVEFRLGAERHTTDDFLSRIHDAGFRGLRWRELRADAALVEEVPEARKYLGRPLLLMIEALRPA